MINKTRPNHQNRHAVAPATCVAVALALTALLGGCGDSNVGYSQQEVAFCRDAGNAPRFFVSSFVATDFNGDGTDDVVIGCSPGIYTSSRPSSVEIWLSDGDDSLEQSQTIELGTHDTGGEDANITTAVDFNEDGNLDLVVLDRGAKKGRDAIVYGRDGGTFDQPEYFKRPIGRVASSDVDGDGHTDLILGITNRSKYYLPGTGGKLDVTAHKRNMAPRERDVKSSTADINGDGLTDAILQVPHRHTLRVYSSRGTRHDLPLDKSKTVITRVLSGGPADGDDVNDLLVKTRNADNQIQIRWLLTEGGPHFGDPIARASKEDVKTVTNYNGDGHADLLIESGGQADDSATKRSLLMGQADGGFKKTGTMTLPGSLRSWGHGDFNADGTPDFVYQYFDENNKFHGLVYTSQTE